MNTICPYALFVFIFNLSGASIYSQEKIVTDRPDQTESSTSIPKGAFQLEVGVLGEELGDHVQHTNISHPTLLLRYGLLENLELRLVQEYNSTEVKSRSEQKIAEQSGMGDLQLGAKIELLNKEDRKTQIGFLSHLIIPSAADGMGEESSASINKFLICHSLSFMGIGANLGFDYRNSKHYHYTYTLSMAFNLSEKIGVFIEPYGEMDQNSNFSNNFNAGFTYLLNDQMQLDLSAGKGLDHQMRFLSFGLSVLLLPN